MGVKAAAMIRVEAFMRCIQFQKYWPNIGLFPTFAFETNPFSLQSIYITRNLAADSVFLRLLSGYDCQVEGRSLIRFTGIPFSELPETDW
jgi:hypothetical protein